jgi:uncharacterized protein YodC (DUF2158 family)
MFNSLFAGRPVEQMTNGAYLAGRILTHRYDPRRAMEIFTANRPGEKFSKAEVQLALELVQEMERRENLPVRDLSDDRIARYIKELSRTVQDLIAKDLKYDPANGQRILEELRGGNSFDPGDVVCLKSGGPPMTVQGFDEAGAAVCRWFEGKVMNTGTFVKDSLEKVPPTPPTSRRGGPKK